MVLKEIILAALLQFAPPEKQNINPWRDDSHEESLERYNAIADAIVNVCEVKKEPATESAAAETAESPKPSAGELNCASLLAALAIGESGLARDADTGPCYRKGGFKTRCDSGQAASVWQVHSYSEYDPQTKQPRMVKVSELFADRTLAARRAYYVARSSWSLCKKMPAIDRLSGLSGSCQAGLKSVHSRYKLWQSIQDWMREKSKSSPPPKKAKTDSV